VLARCSGSAPEPRHREQKGCADSGDREENEDRLAVSRFTITVWLARHSYLMCLGVLVARHEMAWPTPRSRPPYAGDLSDQPHT
jgi:hypothetical protein